VAFASGGGKGGGKIADSFAQLDFTRTAPIWMQRLRRKLSALDPKSRERMLKVILQILDAQRKALSK
jgi:ABC-type thiamine transport system ATPase subunit